METSEREKMGVTMEGRLHGAPATWALLEAMEAEASPNPWDRAQAVADAADPEVANAALWHLLALHALAQEHTEPVVAMRNVREGDLVRLAGTQCYVREVLDNAPSRSQQRTITLKVRLHGPSGRDETFAYGAYVTIPLIAREVQ